MSGMITTGDTDISSYGSRTVAIEVTGVARQDIMRTSNYTIKVPYSRMSQTIKNISRMGGKVANISLGAEAPVDKGDSQPTEEPKRSKKKNRNK